MIKEAMYYKKAENGLTVCYLCPHNCHLKEGVTGKCGVRRVMEGKLNTINYGEVSSIALDPIEKKPLYHFKPGSNILSLGSFGCNFSCGFCQNYTISMDRPDTRYVSPQELLNLALEVRERGSCGVAFTYNEPSIWYEYIYDFIRLKERERAELDVVLVSNGYITLEPLREILPHISAMNIDLKSFGESFYREVCGGRKEYVLETIEEAVKGCHVEITTLVIDDYNSSVDEIRELAKWLSSLNRDVPLHLSRYYPSHKFDAPPTSVESILKLRDEARKYLNYVYAGNVPGEENDTLCPNCQEKLVERKGYSLRSHLGENKCPNCGERVNIVI